MLCSVCYAQNRVLDNKNLPEVIKNETVTVKVEVWVEPIDSEIQQRAKINFLEKKINKIHSTLSDKHNYKHNLDSLFLVIDKITIERDSLNQVLKSGSEDIVKDCTNRSAYLTSQLNSVRGQYFSIRKKHQKLKRKTVLILGVAIIEGLFIAILI
jgi:hypothetical protein